MNPKETFKTAEERAKLELLMLEMVKGDIQAGLIKDWGSSIDGSGGYAIYEVASEADPFQLSA